MKPNRIVATLAAFTLATGALWGVTSAAFADEAVPPTEVVSEQTAAEPTVVEDASVPAEEAPAEEPAEQAPAGEPAEVSIEEPVAVAVPTQEPVEEPAPATQPVIEPVAAFAALTFASAPDNSKKVYVCKIVSSSNSPGGFRLQTGQNPIYVSINAIGNDVNSTGTFNDQQPSFIVSGNDPLLCAHQEVKVEEQITCPSENLEDGIVNVTTTTKYYLGTTLVDTQVVYSTRALTADELDACDTEGPLVATASVSLSDATCFAGQQVVLGTAVNSMWGDITDPVGTDDYSVTATANKNAEFGDAPYLSKTFTGVLLGPIDPTDKRCELPTDPETPDAFAITECGSYGSLSYANQDEVLYTLTEGDGIQGYWKVTATPRDGYYFSTEEQSKTYEGNLGVYTDCATPLPAEFTDTECAESLLDSEEPVTASVGFVIPGYFVIPDRTGVQYSVSINGSAFTDYAAGSYDVVDGDYVVVHATAQLGYTLEGTTEWSHTFAVLGVCDLPTKAEVLATASATNATCAADGSITVVPAEHVLYYLDGAPLTAASTPRAAGSYTVTAATDNPLDYTIIGQKEWVLQIAAASGCATVLAMTGGTMSYLGLSIGGGLLFLGVVAFYIRRRSGMTSE